MKTKCLATVLSVVTLTCVSYAGGSADEATLKSKLPEIFAKSAAHYRALDAAATPLRKGKMSTRKDRNNSDIYMPHGWKRQTGELAMLSFPRLALVSLRGDGRHGLPGSRDGLDGHPRAECQGR